MELRDLKMFAMHLLAIHKGRPADSGGGRVFGIRTFNCYSNVILLFYLDTGGRGV